MIEQIARGKDIPLHFENGFAETEILSGCYAHVQSFRCALKAGSAVERTAGEGVMDFYFFTGGKGYIATQTKAFLLKEVALFVPDFGLRFSIHAETDLRMTLMRVKLTSVDLNHYQMFHVALPFFKPMSECSEYRQSCKTEGTRSWTVVALPETCRAIAGIVEGTGEGEGTTEAGHADLAQWNICLDDANFTQTVDGESAVLTGGDVSYVIPGRDHAMIANKGGKASYIWFEHCVKNEYQW